MTKSELIKLVNATGLKQAEVAAKLDVSPVTLNRWLAGNPLPPHPAMTIKAMQLLILEQRGVITAQLIERSIK